MSKKKLIIAVIIVAAGVLTVNWYAGNQIENEVGKELEDLAVSNPNVELEYDQMKADPMFKSLTITNVTTTNKVYNSRLSADKIKMELGAKDIKQIVDQGQLNKLHSAEVELTDARLGYGDKTEQLKVGDLNLQFTGDLSFSEVKNGNFNSLFKHDQDVKLNLEDGSVQVPKLVANLLGKENLKNKLNKLNQLDVTINYDKDNNELTQDIAAKTPQFNAVIDAQIDVNQESFNISKVKKLKIKLSELSKERELALKRIEQRLGKKFPEDDSGNKIIELTGTLDKLQLK